MKRKYRITSILLICLFVPLIIFLPDLELPSKALDLMVSNVSDLQSAVNTATGDVEIQLSPSFPVTLTSDIILNNATGFNVTIIGNGLTLSSAPGKRHFNVSTTGVSSIKFKSFIFDGKNSSGGIELYPNATVSFENCTFENNVSGPGAAIKLNGNNTCLVTECTFLNNRSAAWGYTGGAIGAERTSNIHLTVKKSYFKDNIGPDANTAVHTGGLGGGIVLYRLDGGSLTVDQCVFNGNKTGHRDTVSDGGAIAIKNNSTFADVHFNITNSTFAHNFAQDDAGAILMEGYSTGKLHGTISNCTFLGNIGMADENLSNGGAIMFYRPYGTINVVYNTFYNNTIGGNKQIADPTKDVSSRGGAVSSFITAIHAANNLFIENNASAAYPAYRNVYSLANKGGNVGFDNGTAISYSPASEIFGQTTPILSDNGITQYVGSSTHRTTLQTLLIAPEQEPNGFANNATGTAADTITLDQRGRARGAHTDSGAVEINWVKFNANTGQWSDFTTTGYNASGSEYTHFTPSTNLADIRYSVDTINQTTVSVPANPTLSGYTFLGWSATQFPVGSGTASDCINTSTLSYDNSEYFAVWQPFATYSVTYTSGVSDPGISGIPATDINLSAGVLYTVSSATPTRPGYTFDGWQTTMVTGSPSTHAAGSTFLMPSNHVILTAIWRSNPGGGATSSAELIKVDASDTSMGLSGAVFELFKQDSNGDITNGRYTTDASGKILVTNLTPGDYYWVEVFPPEGYIRDLTKHQITLVANSKTAVTIKNNKKQVPPILNHADHYAYIIGYTDGSVRPQGNITRAEMATIFFRLLKAEIRDQHLSSSNAFTDVQEGMWHNKAISTLEKLGLVNGYQDGTFRPNAFISRAEFATIAARFDLDISEDTHPFIDITNHWAEKYIAKAVSNGWVNGYGNGTFRPSANISRAEAVTLINRVLQRFPETTDDLLDDMLTWPDNADVNAWFYIAIQEASNSHNYHMKDVRHEKWDSLRTPIDWSQYER